MKRYARMAAVFIVLSAVDPVTAMFIPPAIAQPVQVSLARQVADGRPWNMVMEEGRTGKLILKPDGSGTMEGGPMAMSPTWRETSDGICLKPLAIVPERCVTLRKEGSRIVGFKDGEVKFRLERP